MEMAQRRMIWKHVDGLCERGVDGGSHVEGHVRRGERR